MKARLERTLRFWFSGFDNEPAMHRIVQVLSQHIPTRYQVFKTTCGNALVEFKPTDSNLLQAWDDITEELMRLKIRCTIRMEIGKKLPALTVTGQEENANKKGTHRRKLEPEISNRNAGRTN